MQPESNFMWLWQGVVSNAAYGLIAAGVGLLIAIIKKVKPSWLSPALYGLIGGTLTLVLIRSGAMYAKWPLATPVILVAVVLAAAALHFVAVLVERKSIASAPNDQTAAGQLATRNSELRLIKDEVQKTISFYTEQLRIRDNEAGKNSGRIGELEQKLRVAQGGSDDSTWLRDIATEQAGSLRDCIGIECRVAGHKLIDDNAYLDFLFTVRSHCTYTLTLSDTIGGIISFSDMRFSALPTMFDNSVKALKINKSAYFTIQQRLEPKEAARLLSEQGSFSFWTLKLNISGEPGLESRPFELLCTTSLDQGFIDENYRKAFIKIHPNPLSIYFSYRVNNASPIELPSKPLGTVVNLRASIQAFRPLKVRAFKLVTSPKNVSPEKGVIRDSPGPASNGRPTQSGDELHPNLADAAIDIDRGETVEGWLQFIVMDISPFEMIDPSKCVVRLQIIDDSTEIHLQDITGLVLAGTGETVG